jgi:hypothetical protein
MLVRAAFRFPRRLPKVPLEPRDTDYLLQPREQRASELTVVKMRAVIRPPIEIADNLIPCSMAKPIIVACIAQFTQQLSWRVCLCLAELLLLDSSSIVP